MAQITSPTRLFGTVGRLLTYPITTNIVSPYHYYSATNLPRGMSLNTGTGLISGIPEQTGTFSIPIIVTSSTSEMAAANITLIIAPATELDVPPRQSIISPPTAKGVVGQLFFYQIKSNHDAVSFRATDLPWGLFVSYHQALGKGIGLITGRPAQAGTFHVFVSATDVNNNRANAVIAITIEEASVEDVEEIPRTASSLELNKDFIYSNTWIIPLQPKPNQVVRLGVFEELMALRIYQRFYGLFMDVMIGRAGQTPDVMLGGVLCLDRNLIVRDEYFNFAGDLTFVDIIGRNDPHFSGLGDRYQLVFLEPPKNQRIEYKG